MNEIFIAWDKARAERLAEHNRKLAELHGVAIADLPKVDLISDIRILELRIENLEEKIRCRHDADVNGCWNKSIKILTTKLNKHKADLINAKITLVLLTTF